METKTSEGEGLGGPVKRASKQLPLTTGQQHSAQAKVTDAPLRNKPRISSANDYEIGLH